MNHKTKQQLIDFELKVKELFENGDLPYLMHFCGGNEDQLIEIFKDINEGDYIFSTHRSHYHYLLSGGSEEKLLDIIKRGDSMFVFDKEKNFFTSSIVCGTPCIAAGVAWSLKRQGSDKKVYCFVGDGATDNGHFMEALRYVIGWELPCKFIVEDNDRSVNSTMKDRFNGYTPYDTLESDWLHYYTYKPTYPHAGSGTDKIIKFKQK